MTGPLGYGLQFLKIGVTTALFNFRDLVQYEVSPNRMIRTPSEDDLPDKMGPGKGDIYYGEGWTLGLQTKYRFSVERIPPIGGSWTLTTRQILTYDILDVKNQYVYTVTDIERIIADLDKTLLNKGIAKNVSALSLEQAGEEEELKRLVEARQNWKNLLQKNPAYVWRKDHVLGGKDSSRTALDQFREEKFTAEDNKGELIIFSGGGEFEYSRTITETNTVEFSSSVSLSSTSSFSHEFELSAGISILGSGGKDIGASGSEASIGSSQDFTKARESGTESEQTVGFVLADGDAWDSYSTYVHEGPWGTPIFFTDPGSVTSWPWEQGTVKGVDVELSQGEGNDGPFDYRQGAHYKFTVTSRGVAVKESSGFDFIIYDVPTDNPNSATVKFNANGAPYKIELAQSTANVIVSIYPPERDWKNAAEMEYPVMVQAESAGDYQIAVNKVLKPRFADLRAPRATVTAPYDGQRISPTLFTTDGFKIEAFSDDEDIDRIQLQIRTLQPDGVYQPWQHLTGMLWQNGEANANVTVVPYIERDPERREFTFSWAPAEIQALGVGEYQLRAVAKDAATRLSPDGITQTASPSTDLDPPIVMFRVDDSPPTVLTTIPFYQDKDAARIYHGELSATFNDDMRSTDFSDRTFEVIDLLNNAPPVGGFVSYSPALRKAVFVPVTPFNPNGFYKATINSSVHDLAGNALKSEFSWTFRTTDSPFEETWSIILSATDGDSTDGNNIASVEFGAEEGEDAKDARALTAFGNQLALSFIDDQLTEFDRDTRPADGRLSHHWFFAVKHATDATGNVILSWKPSSKLIQSAAQRQYKELRLVEFIDKEGTPTQQTISLDPSVARDSAGLAKQTDIYTYTPATDELVRYFRLDVMKANFVATTFNAGSSGWRFFSVPITPEIADPFVNMGDDIDPFQMFKYDTAVSGYKVYPLDIGEVALQTGYGYFTRLNSNVEVDVGGATNNTDQTLTLTDAGWHAIGNPFEVEVNIADLILDGQDFDTAAGSLIEGTLYRWAIPVDVTTSLASAITDSSSSITVDSTDAFPSTGVIRINNEDIVYTEKTITAFTELTRGSNDTTSTDHSIDVSLISLIQQDSYQTVTSTGNLKPWEGYWLKTKVPNLTLTIPVPDDLGGSLLPASFNPPSVGAPSASVVQANTQANSFQFRLALRSENSSDLTTTLGTRADAEEGWDTYDASEPPRLSKTVSLYFDHKDLPGISEQLNADYRPELKVGDSGTWRVVATTDVPKETMELSWRDTVGTLSDDMMLYFRRADNDAEWQDMRKVQSVELKSKSLVTRIPFEIRATRIALEEIADLSVVAGEAEVKLEWKSSENLFIEGYTIYRQSDSEQSRQYPINDRQHSFIDTQVEEEKTYTYQVGVRFHTGVELKSKLFNATVRPVIGATVLLQSYPNPFNPETWIPYELEREAEVRIQIYNTNGQLVRQLEIGLQSRGRYINRQKAAYWDGKTEQGEKVASGIYFYQLQAGAYTAIKKMVILK